MSRLKLTKNPAAPVCVYCGTAVKTISCSGCGVDIEPEVLMGLRVAQAAKYPSDLFIPEVCSSYYRKAFIEGLGLVTVRPSRYNVLH